MCSLLVHFHVVQCTKYIRTLWSIMCLGCLVDCDYYCYFDQCRVMALLKSFFALIVEMNSKRQWGRERIHSAEWQTIWLHFPHLIEFKIDELTITNSMFFFLMHRCYIEYKRIMKWQDVVKHHDFYLISIFYPTKNVSIHSKLLLLIAIGMLAAFLTIDYTARP